MSKRPSTHWEPEIDQEYEKHVASLDRVNGSVSDYQGNYAIEPVRQQPPSTWTPATTAVERHQAQRKEQVQALRQVMESQSQDPGQGSQGNKFIIHEETSAKDRAGAGFRWWAMLGASSVPFVFGVGLWLFWGWGFFTFCFVCIGAGLLIGVALLNWQSVCQSPIAIEKRQRNLDHEYRMYKEENLQRTRELVIGGFIGGARQDVERNNPVIDGQLLLTDNQNRQVRR